jgi:hypothetical protein
MDNKAMTPTGSNEVTSIKTFSGTLNCSILKGFIVTLEEKVSKLEARNKILKNDLTNRNSIIEQLISKIDTLSNSIEKVNDKIYSLNDDKKKQEDNNTNIFTNVNQNETQINDLKSKLNEFMNNANSRLEKNEMELVKRDTPKTSLGTYADKLKFNKEDAVEIVKIAKQEQNESLRKENRIIIFGLTKSVSSDQNEIDKHNDDVVTKLFSDLKIDKSKIKSKYRLKQKNIEDKASPMIIELINKEEKVNMLKRSKLLRDLEGYDGVYINNDLTINERELLKQQIIKRNNLNENENTKDTNCTYYYGIRDFEVKKLRKKVSKL